MKHRTAFTAPLAVLAALALAGCDSMVDKETLYAELDEQCRAGFAEGSEDSGAIFCECQTARMREADMGPFDMMDEEAMRAIADECGGEVMDNMREGWNL